jgi:Flp pilus assembly protein TadD
VTAKAEASFIQATQLRQDWTLPYLNLSRLMIESSKPDMAIAVLQRGLQNNPDDATLKLTLASTQQTTKDIDGAMITYRSLLETNPKLDVAANNLAALVADYKYSEPKKLDDALALAQRFQASENPFYLDTLGWLHYRKGDYSLAVVFIAKALENRPDNAQLNFHLGMAQYKAGNAAEARRFLEKAVALGTNEPEIVSEAQTVLKTL